MDGLGVAILGGPTVTFTRVGDRIAARFEGPNGEDLGERYFALGELERFFVGDRIPVDLKAALVNPYERMCP